MKKIAVLMGGTSSEREVSLASGRNVAKALKSLGKYDVVAVDLKADDLSEGLGLGLPLAKRHINNLGGDLFFDLDYDKGCRFIIELPKINNGL